MPKKPKSQTCSTGWCKNHLLQLLPLKNSQCYYRKKMKLRFCPKHNPNTNNFTNVMPLVNHDRRHYTPCFILQEEHAYYKDNDEKLLTTHNLKLEPSDQGTILIPKHGRKKNYCSVCKAQYDDYLEHIEDISHRSNLRNNRFSKFILETQVELRDHSKKDIEIPLESLSKMLDETKDVEREKNRSD